VGLELWNEWQLLVLFVPTVGSRFTAKSFGMYPERYTNEGEPGTGLQEGGKKRRENDEGG
jgi:hypothetical protein